MVSEASVDGKEADVKHIKPIGLLETKKMNEYWPFGGEGVQPPTLSGYIAEVTLPTGDAERSVMLQITSGTPNNSCRDKMLYYCKKLKGDYRCNNSIMRT